MNRIFFFIGALFLLSCNSPENKGIFTVKGELKNAANQKVFLEEISFNQQPPQVFDTAEIKNGSLQKPTSIMFIQVHAFINLGRRVLL